MLFEIARSCSKCTTLWLTLGISFSFCLMVKAWNKRKNNNAKLVLNHQKLQMFTSNVHYFFCFIRIHSQTPSSEGQSVRLCSQIWFWTDVRFSRGLWNGPWRRIFNPRDAKRRSTPLCPERPGADLSTIWRRKRSKDTFSSNWNRFLLALGKIFELFSAYYECYFSKVQRRLT